MIFALYLTCLLIIFVICTILIYNRHYHDGVCKKVALGLLWLICIGVIADSMQGAEYVPLKANMALILGFTGFLVCHFYCWLRYVTGGDFSWHQLQKVVHE